MAADAYDLVIIGGGPGGYVAAIRAGQLGMRTAVVEADRLGGICLNWGCIPTKALLRSAEIYDHLGDLEALGLSATGIGFDLAKIVARSRKISAKLSGGIAHLMKKHKVTVIAGRGRLAGAGKVAVTRDGEAVADLGARNIILATGARSRTLPGIEPDGKLIWSYREAMTPEAMPKSILVIGSGAIGMEFASFYRSFGAKVTVVEVLDRILPAEDAEISDLARKAFEKQGMTIHTGASVASLRARKDSVQAALDLGGGKISALSVSRVIVSVGIVGNVEDLGLEENNIAVEKTHIVVDQWLQTGAKGVFAIGDVVGPPWLAHKAMHEGVLCVERMAGVEGLHPLDVTKIPGCTYCQPQIASVGFSEQAARDAGHAVKVGRFPYAGNGKAVALGEPEGLIKTVFDADTGELLGAHMIGAEVTELIQGYCLARSLEATEADIMATVFPHPTLSEMMHESVLDAYGKALHF